MKLIHNNNIYSRVYRGDSMPYWNVLPAKEEKGETPLYFEFTDSVPTNIFLIYNSSSIVPTTINFEYSYDNVNWTRVSIGVTRITFPTNGNSRIYIRGNNPDGLTKSISSSSSSAHPYFEAISVPFKVGGDVRSLMWKEGFTEQTLGVLKYYFAYIFKQQTRLMEIELPSVSFWSTTHFYNWLQSVSSTGIAYVPTGLNPPRNASGVPSGWTINYIQ